MSDFVEEHVQITKVRWPADGPIKPLLFLEIVISDQIDSNVTISNCFILLQIINYKYSEPFPVLISAPSCPNFVFYYKLNRYTPVLQGTHVASRVRKHLMSVFEQRLSF